MSCLCTLFILIYRLKWICKSGHPGFIYIFVIHNFSDSFVIWVAFGNFKQTFEHYLKFNRSKSQIHQVVSCVYLNVYLVQCDIYLSFRNVLPEGKTMTESNCWKSRLTTQSAGRGRKRRRTQTRDLQVGTPCVGKKNPEVRRVNKTGALA